MLVEIESFVNWQRRRNPNARTWRDYSYDLKQFVAVVGDRPPGEVTFHDVDRFVIAQAERGYQAATINRRLAAITSLYIFLSDDDPELVWPLTVSGTPLKARPSAGWVTVSGGAAVSSVMVFEKRAKTLPAGSRNSAET